MKKIINGKLSVISRYAALKLEGSTSWINPAKEIKHDMIANLGGNKSGFLGKQVQVELNDAGEYLSFGEVPIEVSQECQVKPTESDKVPVKSGVPVSKRDSVLTRDNVLSLINPQQVDADYFNKLKMIEGETEKKGELTYMSWAEAWSKLKEQFSDASYHVFEDTNGLPYFKDSCGGMVKVEVRVCNIDHVVWLPIMDYKNQSILSENITSFDVNRAIQRAFVKAIAMHGLGLYVYKDEDFPRGD